MKKILMFVLLQLLVCATAMAYDEAGCRIHVVRVDEHQEQAVPVSRYQKYEKIKLHKPGNSPYPMGKRSFIFESADAEKQYSYQVTLHTKVKYKASGWSLDGDKLEVEAILQRLSDKRVVAVTSGHSDQVKSPGMLKAMREGDGEMKWSPEAGVYVTVNKTIKARAFLTLNNPDLYEIILNTEHPMISEMRDSGGLDTAAEYMDAASVDGERLASPHMLDHVNIECMIEKE